MTKQLVRLASRIYNTPLAIDPSKLDVIMKVLGPRVGWPEALAVEDMVESTEQAVPSVDTDGIAVIEISGTMVARTNGLDAMSGLVSYESIGDQVVSAAIDPAVRAIMLRIDSPGGETSGAFDLADLIADVAEEKPVWAIADQTAFSAGYLMASQARRVYVTRTSGVGSIGVLAIHVDESAADKAEGLKYTILSTGARKTDLNPHEPLGDEAKKWLQSEMERLYGMFVSAVARGRRMDAAAVRATEAGRFFGENAIGAGLADRVGTFTDALKDMTAALDGPSRSQVVIQGGMMVPSIGKHKTATSDADWDGPANKARLRNDGDEAYYRKAYAWQNPDADSSTKAAYKFINHEVAEDGAVGAANVRGCQSGIGVLNGARGGTTIPSGDRQGVYDHLAGHIRDAGSEPAPLKSEAELAADAPGIAEMIKEAKAAGYAEALEILDLCAIAGKLRSATKFITDRTPIADVRKVLLDARVGDEGGEIHPFVSPDDGGQTGTKSEDSPLAKAVEAIADGYKRGGK